MRRGHAEADRLDLGRLLARLDQPGDAIRNTEPWNGRVETGELNAQLLADALAGLERDATSVELSYPITNVDRTISATLSGAVAQRYGVAGLPEGTIKVAFTGSAGQSFGRLPGAGPAAAARRARPTTMSARAWAAARSSCSRRLVARYATHENTIIGNTVLLWRHRRRALCGGPGRRGASRCVTAGPWR